MLAYSSGRLVPFSTTFPVTVTLGALSPEIPRCAKINVDMSRNSTVMGSLMLIQTYLTTKVHYGLMMCCEIFVKSQ